MDLLIWEWGRGIAIECYLRENMCVGMGWHRRAQCQSRERMSLISYIMILNYPWDI